MSKHTQRATAQRTPFDELKLTFPYHPGLVDDLKDSIPYRCRSYTPSTKTWLVFGGYQDLAIDILLDYFPDAETPRRSNAKPQSDGPAHGSDPFAVLHLLPTAPRALVDAAYRTLAKSAHPDLGGSDQAMRRLSEAHEALSRRLSA